MSVILFIDANQYLNFYRMTAGNRLLDSLEEQKDHIFISAQIVDEVLRNKLRCAKEFFSAKFKEIDANETPVPDHLLGISNEKTTELRNGLAKTKGVKTELIDLAAAALPKISRSEDDVSKRLRGLFDKAVSPSADEIQRARSRRERGNPPGKPGNALGDQITWEQLLAYCKGKECKRLWIITDDQDFFEKWNKHSFLNSLLYRDLTDACGSAPEVRCFSDLATGISDFGNNAGVTARKLLTPTEATEIKKEIEGLPPHDWMTAMDNNATMAVILNHHMRRQRAYVAALDNGTSFAITPLALTTAKPTE
jgi:PIN domain